MALLIAALVLFVAFHFLKGFGSRYVGWHVWYEISNAIWRPKDLFEQPKTAVIISSFLTFSLLILASPFLGCVWVKSRLAWWMAVIFSSLTVTGFWVLMFARNPTSTIQSGGWCLLIAPLLNFAGLVLARGKTPPNPGSPAV